MTTSRKILASAALGLAVLSVARPAQAADGSPSPVGDHQLELSDQHDAAARRCRWVPRIGLVCDTANGTITI